MIENKVAKFLEKVAKTVAKNDKIFTSKINWKVRNIYNKPFLKPPNTYNKPCFKTAYLGKKEKKL